MNAADDMGLYASFTVYTICNLCQTLITCFMHLLCYFFTLPLETGQFSDVISCGLQLTWLFPSFSLFGNCLPLETGQFSDVISCGLQLTWLFPSFSLFGNHMVSIDQ